MRCSRTPSCSEISLDEAMLSERCLGFLGDRNARRRSCRPDRGGCWHGCWIDARLVPMAMLLALPLPFVGMAGALQGLLNAAEALPGAGSARADRPGRGDGDWDRDGVARCRSMGSGRAADVRFAAGCDRADRCRRMAAAACLPMVLGMVAGDVSACR